ncbi:multiprotein bridging factor aMBF1 [Candidatus Bathycorpusculum sp.]|uniref:multiprotein bridging factor aMBF1 n=1 Tax=Candidatus Bathycorpusculum sp. TaxID=2994959 RepID=UPI002833B11E|nr:multiprotein bridging factor aMBF1 [Candidatus Termitimicrobium sp.]
MRCEVCGRKIHTDPVRAVIEGAKLTVCVECSKHGKVVVHEEVSISQPSPTKSYAHIPVIMKKPPVAQVQITTEIVDDYAVKIRSAREKLGLSHDDLGKKINEKTSVLRHIETGKIAPTNQLANKLEHALKIKLMVPIADEKVTAATPKKLASEGLTLGDLIEMTKPDEEAPSRRKPS